MGKRQPRAKSSLELVFLSALTCVSLALGFLLLSNHDGVKNLNNEVARTEEDLIDLVRQIRDLSQDKMTPEEERLEAEKLARERLHWAAPGEFIIQVDSE
ncbi:MAG: hypothetical protein KC944_00055 [Candidatus Omnitrophica bacterium]|nr:hypothetical protein [Candidatus Omnitrophota bacterium]